MAVQPNIATAFGATLEDNGNAIALPPNSNWKFSTDDSSDTIAPQSLDGSIVLVTVNDPPEDRTQLTVTAETTAPDGSDVSGSVTTDIVPGVTHTYTVSVSQVQMQQVGRSR